MNDQKKMNNEIENWAQKIRSARLLWDRLTADELFQTQGDMQKLTGLVQKRYALAYKEANKQVKNFIENKN